MRLARVRLSNFQSFGPVPTMMELADTTYLLGPNGAGKTALLAALARMFAMDPQMRRVRRSDFHIPHESIGNAEFGDRVLWIEADFTFPELMNGTESPSVPSFFSQMRITAVDEPPRIRIRLTAEMDSMGEIEETIAFVTEADADGEPLVTTALDRYERSAIQVHYLPARRDPAQHLALTSNTLLGRLLRAVDWTNERVVVEELTAQLSDCLAGNDAVTALGTQLSGAWGRLHRGTFFSTPAVSFAGSDVEALLRNLTVTFDTVPGEGPLDWTRLSDGQQSLLYVALVVALHDLGTRVLAGEVETVDAARLRPASFTLIALEEPENSLSPHYLGRVMKLLSDFAQHPDTQTIIATHAPSVVRRVQPESIRYLRLTADRQTLVAHIELPPSGVDGYKFVREAVEAFPELYFARLVVLGEGDSEQIVLPRMLQAVGELPDIACISIVPLGGRHVHHFWRLLNGLEIPYVTLLDLDVGRHDGGWGRVRYARDQFLKHRASSPSATKHGLNLTLEVPQWNDPTEDILKSDRGREWLDLLERYGVFFSSPLDLDFGMMTAYPEAYGIDESLAVESDDASRSMLGTVWEQGKEQYSAPQRAMFGDYRRLFINGSKPAAHLGALSTLTDEDLKAAMPESMSRLLEYIKSQLARLPE